MKTLLPQFSVKRSDKSIRKRNTKVKQKRKQYADRKTGAKRSTVKTGDAVLVKQPNKNKLTPPFNPNPGVILDKKDSSDKTTLDTCQPKRIPQRERKKPVRFKDYVC